MKRLLAVTVCLLGVLLPGYGALAQQQDGEILDAIVSYGEEEIYELSWEDIPVDLETEWLDRADPEILEQEKKTIIEREFHRTHHEDMVMHWWEVDGAIPDYGINSEIEMWAVAHGAQYDIAPELILAICWKESRFTPTAKNGQYHGLMQIGVRTHAKLIESLGYTVDQMYEIEPNIHVGAAYLASLFADSQDLGVVLCRYNGDTAGLLNYKQTGHLPYYARKILAKSEELERMVGK